MSWERNHATRMLKWSVYARLLIGAPYRLLVSVPRGDGSVRYLGAITRPSRSSSWTTLKIVLIGLSWVLRGL